MPQDFFFDTGTGDFIEREPLKSDAPDIRPEAPKNCPVCGREMNRADGSSLLEEVVRRLDQDGLAVRVYGSDGDYMGMVGPANSTTDPFYLATADTEADAVIAAAKFRTGSPSIDVPGVGKPEADERGFTLQWAVPEHPSTDHGLFVWQGDRLLNEALIVGSPNECIEKLASLWSRP